jgi:hypothetical protein
MEGANNEPSSSKLSLTALLASLKKRKEKSDQFEPNKKPKIEGTEQAIGEITSLMMI